MSMYGQSQIKDLYRKGAFKSVLVKINYNMTIFASKYIPLQAKC